VEKPDRVRLYLETSVPNFLFVDDAPDKRQRTERLFAQLAQGRHQAWISDLYIEEIERASDEWRRNGLRSLITQYGLQLLVATQEVISLRQEYIAAQAFTAANRADAQHVALAVLGQCETVVSWNFRHIVRDWTIQRVAEVNARLGLPSVVICTPEEVNSQ